jgi:hypothetical protein
MLKEHKIAMCKEPKEHNVLWKEHKKAHFYTARLWFFPASIACLRLQELRRKSRCMKGPYTLAGIAHMSESEARKGYTTATVAALGQLACASPETRVRMFLHVMAYVEAAKAMDGLESLMLSGIEACYLAGAFAAAQHGMKLWNQHAHYSSRQKASIAVFLPLSQRIGFIGTNGSGPLAHFRAYGIGAGGGLSASVFSHGMPGAAIGNQLANSLDRGFEQMDGSDACKAAVRYGVGSMGAAAGAVTGFYGGAAAGAAGGAAVGGPGGAFVGAGIGAGAGAVGGFLTGLGGGMALGNQLGSDFCGGSSPAPSGQADQGNQGVYLGDVDDPNFVGGQQPGADSSAPVGSSQPSSGSSDTGTYLGDVDDPNFISGGAGSSGDSSGGSPGSGASSGGYDNPEADPTTSGASPRGGNDGTGDGERGRLGGMDNPETGIGDGPLPRGFYQGGYAATSHTFLTQKGLQGAVRGITPALYQLNSLPLLAESSYGTILFHAGLLQGAHLPGLQSESQE